MNMEDRQHPRQSPHGTFAAPVPDRSNASVPRSQSEKLPASTLPVVMFPNKKGGPGFPEPAFDSLTRSP
jgi:hypothetical protein